MQAGRHEDIWRSVSRTSCTLSCHSPRQLDNQTITDAIHAAVLGYIEQRKSALSSRAEAALAEIERDAAARRQAITALFGEAVAPSGAVEAGSPPTTRSGRSKGAWRQLAAEPHLPPGRGSCAVATSDSRTPALTPRKKGGTHE